MCRLFKKKEKGTGRDTSKPWWISDSQRREDETIGGEYGDTPEWARQNKKIMRNQTCPYCYSNKVIDAGYGGRMKCRNCGRVFS